MLKSFHTERHRHVGMFKTGKWAKEIISLQKPNGMWGYFHTLSEPTKTPITTEQALRRLSMGYTIEDECIAKAVEYMNDCLSGKEQIPDRREKVHNWDIFTDLMLSTWIRRFTKDNALANRVSDKWTSIISSAFAGGVYDRDACELAYQKTFGIKPKGGRLVDFVNFYQVSLIADCLDAHTEAAVFHYILNHENGIYYVYDNPLSTLPETFMSKQASRYLAAMELMTGYRRNRHKLQFVVDWLNRNKNENGMWDMGAAAKDHVHFPLSDDWKRRSVRENDCTYRVRKFIDMATVRVVSESRQKTILRIEETGNPDEQERLKAWREFSQAIRTSNETLEGEPERILFRSPEETEML